MVNLTDDIIRLNKKEQQLKRRQATVNRRPVKKKGRLTQGKGVSSRAAGAVQRGVYAPPLLPPRLEIFSPFETPLCMCSAVTPLSLPGGGVARGGTPKLRNRRVPPPPGRRRGQGVITGLAARRPAALLKRVGTFNRTPVNQVMEDILESTTRQAAAVIGLKPHCRLLATLALMHTSYWKFITLTELNK